MRRVVNPIGFIICLASVFSNAQYFSCVNRYFLMKMKIFFFRRQAAPDMTLRFVDVQNPPHFGSQGWIDFSQTFHAVFMNGAFTHAKLLGRLAHGCVGCYDIICDFDGSLFNIILQGNPPIVVFLQCMRGEGELL